MESMWETIKKGLQEGASTAVNKAEELTRLGHARLDIAAVKNRIHQLQTELGAEVYRRFESEDMAALEQSSLVRDLCERISVLKEKLQDKEKELEMLRSELAESRESEEQSEEQEDAPSSEQQ